MNNLTSILSTPPVIKEKTVKCMNFYLFNFQTIKIKAITANTN